MLTCLFNKHIQQSQEERESAFLLQIGHNAAIGKSCMLCGQVGIAGSATYVTSSSLFTFFFLLLLVLSFWSTLGLRCIWHNSIKWQCATYVPHDFFSFRIGDYVTLGGRVAVRDHVSIASKVHTWRSTFFPIWRKKRGLSIQVVEMTLSFDNVIMWSIYSYSPIYNWKIIDWKLSGILLILYQSSHWLYPSGLAYLIPSTVFEAEI